MLCLGMFDAVLWSLACVLCFFQAEDGIRDLVRSRGLGDVYKRQDGCVEVPVTAQLGANPGPNEFLTVTITGIDPSWGCLLYTSDAADERSSVDLGGRRIIKKKNRNERTDDDGIK